MRRYILLPVLLLLGLSLCALPSMQAEQHGDDITFFGRNLHTASEQQFIQHTWALPAQEAGLTILSMETGLYDTDGNLISVSTDIDPTRVELTHSFIMRELRGFTVRIESERPVGAYVSRIHDVDYQLSTTVPAVVPDRVSSAFRPIYERYIDNFETSYISQLQITHPHMMIIGHNGMEAQLAPFIAWKKSLGFTMDYYNVGDIGSEPDVIKNFIAAEYAAAEHKPDYLLLIGDVDGQYGIPSFYIGVENNVADLPYTCIEGEDYLPEMIAGRFSISSLIDLMTISTKTIMYERQPFMENTDWFESALVVAGNYSDTGLIPVTPVLMSRWLTFELYEHGYTAVDTFFYPGTYPGTNEIINSISEGRQFISYRGWGAAEGWHYPQFHNEHLDETTNGQMMPIVTSIVCNTGDFANPNINPCFGEKWMRLGTPAAPKGCVAFTGPSDLHTNTEFNNAVSSGFYYSVLEYGIRGFGTAVLGGKYHLYDNYPNNLASGDKVEHYFYVYNILSDPSLNMWVLTPETITADTPESVNQGTNFIELNTSCDDGLATATTDMLHFTEAAIHNGHVILPINTTSGEEVRVTISSENCVPLVVDIPINQTSSVALEHYQFQNVNPGGTATVNLTALNQTGAAVDLTVTLSSTSSYVTFDNPTVDFGNVADGANAQVTASFELAGECPHNEVLHFDLAFSTGETAKLVTSARGLVLEVIQTTVIGDGFLSPGETADVTFHVRNNGTFAASGLTATIMPSTDAVGVSGDAVSFGDIQIDGMSEGSISVTAASDAYPGRLVRFVVDFTDDSGHSDRAYAWLTLGPVDNTHPTGPDGYGYYCYDSNDTAWELAPDYEWNTIDPNEGGSGTVILMRDDVSSVIDLPFTFRYYGQDFDTATVCSNGWLAFGETWEVAFRNWNIPSALGPDNMIAAYWDDLKGEEFGPGDDEYEDIRLVYWHDAANNRFIVQWNDAMNNDNGTSPERFEIILEPRAGDDGDIIINYHSVDNPDAGGNYCTVGIQDQDHHHGLVYSYANIYPASATTLQPNLSLRFTTIVPDGYTGADHDGVPPVALELGQNYPNPFNPETTIGFGLPEAGHVRLEIYNVLGQRIRTLVDDNRPAGQHEVVWHGDSQDGHPVGSGIYLYRITTGGKTVTRRMVLMK